MPRQHAPLPVSVIGARDMRFPIEEQRLRAGSAKKLAQRITERSWDCALNDLVFDRRDTQSELHIVSTSIWDGLRSPILFIH